MSHQPIKVLIVDDSPLFCKILTEIINSDSELIVCGAAHNGQEAVELVKKLKPHVVTMDIHMPKMDGFEATKQIMAYFPTPILIVSSSTFVADMNLVFKALAYGALDVICKSAFEKSTLSQEALVKLVALIKMLAGIKVITHPLGRIENASRTHLKPPIFVTKREKKPSILALVASTGGPQALLTVLRALPAELSCAVVIVQHISDGFAEGFVNWLGSECKIKVELATHGKRVQPGVAYVAPTGVQMRIAEGGFIRLTGEAPFNGQRPSGSLLFESVARIYQERAIGVILTGIGTDGCMGLKKIHECKGHVIAEDETSCVVFGMPKAAIEAGVVDDILPLDKIASKILSLVI